MQISCIFLVFERPLLASVIFWFNLILPLVSPNQKLLTKDQQIQKVHVDLFVFIFTVDQDNAYQFNFILQEQSLVTRSP